ncbi:MAG: C13 family peptidase [Caulobacteraceae bacterium]
MSASARRAPLLAPLSLLIAFFACGPALARGGFASWAAIVIAGDDHAAHAAVPTRAFDNARRDIAALLARRGFSAAHIAQFSADPAKGSGVSPDDPKLLLAALARLTAAAPGGCLFYITSHGNPDGVVFGSRMAPPIALERTFDQYCPNRPVVAVISACFSGVFIPALKGPDRLVLTAARADRSSFGCSESDLYPYFDACMLKVLPHAASFIAVIPLVRRCVAEKEREEDVGPPSDPQAFVGPKLPSNLPAFSP